jgi:hypothetical protein
VKRVDLPVSRSEKSLELPVWHRTVLEDREKAFKAGKVTTSDWEQAKKRIKKNVL